MTVKNLRLYSLLPFLATVSFIAYALYSQYYLYLLPCPLCMVQRYTFIIIGSLFLVTLLFNPKRWVRKLFGIIISLFSIFGIFVAGRHVWIQNLPEDEVPACGPGLDYMIEAFPLSDIIKELLHGSGDCHEVVWRFLGLSMPSWSLICFIGFFIYTILWTTLKQKNNYE
jgi:disulfide bond formation protein DsbB